MFFNTNVPSLAQANAQLGKEGVRVPTTAYFGQPPVKEVGKVFNSKDGINWANNPMAVTKQMGEYMSPSTCAADIFTSPSEVDLAKLFDKFDRPSLIADGNRVFDLGTEDDLDELMDFLQRKPSFKPNVSVIRNIPTNLLTGAASPIYTKGSKMPNVLTASDLSAFDDADVENLIEHLVKTVASRGLNCITFAIDLEEMAFYNVSSVLTPGTERQIIDLIKNAKI